MLSKLKLCVLELLYPMGYNRIIPNEGDKVHGNRRYN